MFTCIASVASVVLAAIAGKKPAFAICTAIAIFAFYTALRIYQTDGHFMSYWVWSLTTVTLAVGCQGAYDVTQESRRR